jgi:N6-adenosine-specific RNA methylase IME4
VYADPHWRYEHVETANRAIENQYPTMDLDAICDLPIASLVADRALLFLWATSPKLAEAKRVMSAWDFEYRTSFVWVKNQIGMGYYVRQQHEL